jgi:ribosomal protein S18 acetylase RimI-like enzyme
MPEFFLLPFAPDDRAWVRQMVRELWGADYVVSRGGTIHYPHTLPGFMAMHAEERAGFITYHIEGDQCEIVTLDSLRPSIGIGAALIAAVKDGARAAGCARVWLITTNDNTHALRFYQKRGFMLAALHRNAIAEARKLKPQISLLGNDGIPIRDEIELEIMLA